MEITKEYIQDQDNPVNTLMTLSTLMDDLVLKESQDSFLSFVRMVAPTLVSDWKMGRHIKLLSDKLQRVKDGEIKRLRSCGLCKICISL